MTELLEAPHYCQYADGPCDQTMPPAQAQHVLFLYPSLPEAIAHTIEAAVAKLPLQVPGVQTRTWREIGVAGQTIYCEICKSMRSSSTVVTDVTTLNFNLMFE